MFQPSNFYYIIQKDNGHFHTTSMNLTVYYYRFNIYSRMKRFLGAFFYLLSSLKMPQVETGITENCKQVPLFNSQKPL